MNASEVLQAVVEVLNQDNADSRRLWNILSALRGPDNGNGQLKSETTSRLRYHIGINGTGGGSRQYGLSLRPDELAGPNGCVLSTSPLPVAFKAAEVAREAAAGAHFAAHIESAIEALRYFQDVYAYPKR